MIGPFQYSSYSSLIQPKTSHTICKLTDLNLLEKEIKYESFLKAIENKNISKVKRIIEEGSIDINEILIQSGACKENKDIRTLLHSAIFENHKEICEILIQAGANVNKGDKDGKTPLIYAVFCGYEEICKVLIQIKANINQKDNDGNTALHFAVSEGHVDISQLLISHGANITHRSKTGYSAYSQIKLAPSKNHEAIKNVFEKNLDKLSLAEAKEYDKAFRLKKLIGHVTELQGNSAFVLKNKRQIYSDLDLEFTTHPHMLKEVEKNIKLFSKEFPVILDSETSALLSNAFQAAADARNRSPAEKIASWKRGEPLILSTGYVNHFVTVLFWDNFFVLCNRSPITNSQHSDFRTYALKKELLTEDIIKQIENLVKTDEKAYSQFFSEVMPAALQFSDTDLKMMTSCFLARQKVSNCAYASSEGMILPLLILNACKKAGIDLSNGKVACPNMVPEQLKKFINWRFFHKLTVLQKYQKRCLSESRMFFPDTSLLKRGVENLESIINKNLYFPSPEGFYPKLFTQWLNFRKSLSF